VYLLCKTTNSAIVSLEKGGLHAKEINDSHGHGTRVSVFGDLLVRPCSAVRFYDCGKIWGVRPTTSAVGGTMHQLKDDGEAEAVFASLKPLWLLVLRELCAQSEENKQVLSAFAMRCRWGDTSLSARHVQILKEWRLIEPDGSIREDMQAFMISCTTGEGSTFQLRRPMSAGVH
jgi:hypothetical protein